MILVVEDNVDDGFLLTRQLKRIGLEHEVCVMGNGEDALAQLLRMSPVPKVVFLDLKLPGMSGIELLEKIRHEPRFYFLPVVVMTGSLDPKDAERCARLGITAYLTKPASLEVFTKIIDCSRSQRSFLPRSIDPHFADLAMSH